jgi:hypothetical protein
MRYPEAEWLPWRPESPDGRPTFYAGANRPIAVVLHTMQGYASTAREWAARGHFGQSWHYTVARDGRVYQHLEHEDGGYHAGISATHAAAHPPAWPLWRGPATNVNHYTIGIEHEGFAGDVFRDERQRRASRKLCRWLALALEIALDEARFPAHAEIDVVNRVNDFDYPSGRAWYYRYLLEESDMTRDEIAAIARDEARKLIEAEDIEVDARLRTVETARHRLTALANDIDATRVERALRALEVGGIL